MKKIVSLVVLCLAALFTCGCEKLSEDKHQDFVMMTPDVGNLTFKKLTPNRSMVNTFSPPRRI